LKRTTLFLKESRDFKIAMSLVKRNQHLDALDRFKVILANNPDSLADILVPLYKRLAIRYDDLHLRKLISELYIVVSQYRNAVDELEEIFEINPHFTQIYFLLAKIYSKNTQKTKIKYLFEEAVKKDIYDTSIVDILPKIYLQEESLEKSIGLYERIVNKKPKTTHFLRVLAELYIKAKRYEEASKIYQNLADLLPGESIEIAKKCEFLFSLMPNSVAIGNLLAKLYFKNYQPEKAIEAVERLIENNSGFLRTAITLYEEALKTYPDTVSILMAVSGLYVSDSRYTEAIECLRSVFEKDGSIVPRVLVSLKLILEKVPNQVVAYYLMTDIYIGLEAYDEVISCLREISKIDLDSLNYVKEKLGLVLQKKPELKDETSILMAELFLDRNEPEKSLALVKTLNGTIYENKAWLIKAKILKSKNKLKASRDLLLQLIEKENYLLEAHLEAKQIYDELIVGDCKKKEGQDIQIGFQFELDYEGLSFLRKGDFVKALECFQGMSTNSEEYWKVCFFISRCFMEMGRYDLAISHLVRLLANLDKKGSEVANEARLFMGLNYFHKGSVRDAINSFEEIISYDVNFYGVSKNLEWLKKFSLVDIRGTALSGCFGGADLVVTSIFNMENGGSIKDSSTLQSISFAHPYNEEGVDYMIKNHIQAALDSFNLALQMDPGFTVAYCNLAFVYIIKNEHEKAKEYIDAAAKINNKLDLVYQNRGLVAVLEKDWGFAIENFNKTIELNPENMIAKINLGDVYYNLGDLNKAFLCWQEVMDINMYYYFIQRRLNYLLALELPEDHWRTDYQHEFLDLFKAGNK
jgi:tetratricopeptide (TPR) repeat protein